MPDGRRAGGAVRCRPRPSDPATGTLPAQARRKWMLSGRVLNVRPPKFVVARKVLKDVISTAAGVRMGVATFGQDQRLVRSAGAAAAAEAALRQVPSASWTRSALARAELVQGHQLITFRNNERSIGEALFGLGGYFSSQQVDERWAKWFTNPLNPGLRLAGRAATAARMDEPLTGKAGLPLGLAVARRVAQDRRSPGRAGARSAPCASACQASSVIVLTDGAPRTTTRCPSRR